MRSPSGDLNSVHGLLCEVSSFLNVHDYKGRVKPNRTILLKVLDNKIKCYILFAVKCYICFGFKLLDVSMCYHVYTKYISFIIVYESLRYLIYKQYLL